MSLPKNSRVAGSASHILSRKISYHFAIARHYYLAERLVFVVNICVHGTDMRINAANSWRVIECLLHLHPQFTSCSDFSTSRQEWSVELLKLLLQERAAFFGRGRSSSLE
jgi:hypothetical protein